MPISFWKQASVICAFLVLTACGGPGHQWRVVNVDDGGDFQVEMPQPASVQQGTIELVGENTSTHIHIVADSGITYVASWFLRPTSLSHLSGGTLRDSVWDLLHTKPEITILDEAGPIGTLDTDSRQAWVLAADSTRLGVVMMVHGDRIVILNTGTPEAFFGERERRNITRFLSSYRPL